MQTHAMSAMDYISIDSSSRFTFREWTDRQIHIDKQTGRDKLTDTTDDLIYLRLATTSIGNEK